MVGQPKTLPGYEDNKIMTLYDPSCDGGAGPWARLEEEDLHSFTDACCGPGRGWALRGACGPLSLLHPNNQSASGSAG